MTSFFEKKDVCSMFLSTILGYKSVSFKNTKTRYSGDSRHRKVSFLRQKYPSLRHLEIFYMDQEVRNREGTGVKVLVFFNSLSDDYLVKIRIL